MVLSTTPDSDRFSAASAIPRPLFSARAPRAHIQQRGVMTRPQTSERSTTATVSPLQHQHPHQHQRHHGAPTSTRREERVVHGGGSSTLPQPSRLGLAISPATTPSPSRPAPAPAHMPRERPSRAAAAPGPSAPNFSRPQMSPAAATGAGAGARPAPTRRLTPVREVGFEKWAIRHESVAALPRRGREYTAATAAAAAAALAGIVRPYSTIYEEEDAASSEQLPALASPASAPSASERGAVRWQRNSARKQPAALLRAPAVRSHAASLVATTATATGTGTAAGSVSSSSMGVRSLGTGTGVQRTRTRALARPSLLEHGALAAASMSSARTYLDMQAVAERAPTVLPAVSVGSLAHLGENFSPWSAGTSVGDIHRRAALARKFDAPGNALGDVERERTFACAMPFVDAPVPGRLGRVGRDGGRKRVGAVGSVETLGGVESAVPIATESSQGEKKTREKKKQGRLRRSLASVLRKLRRKGKKTASPSSPSSSVPTPPSLVQALSSNEISSPATPTQLHSEPQRVPPAPKRAVPAATPKRKRIDAGAISPLPPSEQARPLRAVAAAAEPVSPLSFSGPSPASKHRAAGPTPSPPPRRREYGTLARPRNRSSPAPASNKVNCVVPVPEALTPSPEPEPRANEIDDLLCYQPWESAAAASQPETLDAEFFEALKQEADAAGWGSDCHEHEQEQEQGAQAQPVQVVGKGKARLVETRPPQSRYRYRGKRRDTLAEVESGAKGGDGGSGSGSGSGSWPLADGLHEHGHEPVLAISGLRL